MNIVIVAIILAVVFYVVIVRFGNLSFWKKAAKKPEIAFYQLLKDDDAWIIDGEPTKISKKECDSPFFLYVPSQGKTIKFYGIIGKYEESQKRIEEEL